VPCVSLVVCLVTCLEHVPFFRVNRRSCCRSNAYQHSSWLALTSNPPTQIQNSYAIHTTERAPADLKAAQAALPRPWPTAAPGVYHTGWHAQGSFGGAGWLIVRGGGRGNVLVDSPRFNPVLAKQIEALGGVEFIFLTHRWVCLWLA
jgi:hypothetical protein